MKKIIFTFLFTILCTSSFAADEKKELVRIQDFCLGSTSCTYGPGKPAELCKQVVADRNTKGTSSGFEFNRNPPDRAITCLISGGDYYGLGTVLFCPEGTQYDFEKMGCYGEKKEEPKVCPVAGTVVEKMKDSVMTGAYSQTFCDDSCEVKGTLVVDCLTEPDGKKYCNLIPPFTYTGKSCTYANQDKVRVGP